MITTNNRSSIYFTLNISRPSHETMAHISDNLQTRTYLKLDRLSGTRANYRYVTPS